MRQEYGLTKLEVQAIRAMEFAPLEKLSLRAKSAGVQTQSLAAVLRRLRDKRLLQLEGIYNPFAV